MQPGAILEYYHPYEPKRSNPARAPLVFLRTRPIKQHYERLKWLSILDTEWEAAFKREVSDGYAAELEKLKQRYLVSILNAGVNHARSAGVNMMPAALLEEHKRFSVANNVPAQDNADDPPVLKELRAQWRERRAQCERERAARAKALHEKYDRILDKAQATLMQRERSVEVRAVQARRAEVAAAWLGDAHHEREGIYTDAEVGSMLSMWKKEEIEPIRAAADAPGPTRPSSKFLFRSPPRADLAEVFVEDVAVVPLAKDEKLWSDREERVFSLPAKFKYYQFTRRKAHGTALYFRVLGEGMVYLACPSCWGRMAKPEAGKDFTSREMLKKDGWALVPVGEIVTTAKGLSLAVYSRACKAGEAFTYCTAEDAPPILLVK
jgi:hypothetical protein